MGIRGRRPGINLIDKPEVKKREYNTDSHRNLCLVAGKWLRKPGRISPVSCPWVAVELVTTNQETPDVFGWNYWTTILIEVKVSRSDFLADSKKIFRQHPEQGLGEYRYYCCPEGLIGIDDLPANWGLLYEIDGNIKVVKQAERQVADYRSERLIYASIMRRQCVKPQLFDYRNNNRDEKV